MFPYRVIIRHGGIRDNLHVYGFWNWMYDNIGPELDEWTRIPVENGYLYGFKTPEHLTLFTLTWL